MEGHEKEHVLLHERNMGKYVLHFAGWVCYSQKWVPKIQTKNR